MRAIKKITPEILNEPKKKNLILESLQLPWDFWGQMNGPKAAVYLLAIWKIKSCSSCYLSQDFAIRIALAMLPGSVQDGMPFNPPPSSDPALPQLDGSCIPTVAKCVVFIKYDSEAFTEQRYWGPKNSLFLYWCFPQLQIHWKNACVPSSTFPLIVLLNCTSLGPLPIVPEIFLIVKQCHMQATIWVSNSTTQHCHGHWRGRLSLALGNNKCLFSGNYDFFCVNFERHFAGACYCGAPGEMQPTEYCAHF